MELVLFCHNATQMGKRDQWDRCIHPGTLSKAEQNYSQIEKEGLACVFGVKRFHCYLYGRSFILSSDHKPLTSLFSKEKSIPVQASARIQRWALTLGMYEYELIHKSGSSHGNAMP